jgi:hypothetical protein
MVIRNNTFFKEKKMKKIVVNDVICKGDFFGGEIEPGTFHVQNYPDPSQPQKSDARCISNSEEPTSEEEANDSNDSAKDGPKGQ